MGAMTSLKAVNRMLRAAGEAPVNSLTDDGVNDVSIAEQILEQITEDLQLGLNASTTVETRQPDSNGYIAIPDNTIEIDTTDDDRGINVSMRGRNPTRLFNVDDNTLVWTDEVEVLITVAQDFEALPSALQLWVADEAAREYQMSVVGDRGVDRILADRSMRSRARARAADMRERDANWTQGRNQRSVQIALRNTPLN